MNLNLSPLALAIIIGQKDEQLETIISDLESFSPLSEGEKATLATAYERLALITAPGFKK